MSEVWRPVPSLSKAGEPTVMASSLGRIRIAPYTRAMPHGGTRIYGGAPTFGQWDGKRFIYSRKRKKTCKVARLVCEAFHGPAPKEKPYCLHGDENSRNNASSNLSWGTQKENLNAPAFKTYCRNRTGESSPTRKAKARRRTA